MRSAGWLVLVLCCCWVTTGSAQQYEPIVRGASRLDYSESQKGNIYTYRFPDADSLRLVASETDPGVTVLADELAGEDQYLRLSVPEGVFRIVVAGHGEKLGISIDNRLFGALSETDSTVVFSQLSGGAPPYRLLLYRDSVYVAELPDLPPGNLTLDKQDLLAKAPAGGQLNLRMLDADGKGQLTFNDKVITLGPGARSTQYIYLIPVALALILFIYLLLPRRVKPVTAPVTVGLSEDDAAKDRISGMRISPRPEVPRKEDFPFRPLTHGEGYLQLGLSRHWDASRVRTVWMGHRAVQKLGEFLKTENLDKKTAQGAAEGQGGWEASNSVPEIGGMLLGQFHLLEDGLTYDVSLERFVPLEAKYQSAVKVEIDPLSLARDLGNAQDEHPELSVIAWFHTHPGHGLFLSRPDLQIQHSHFRKPYHLAMEIDSLSEGLDTGFFSYDPSGLMNNRNTLRPGSPWFSWHDISAASESQNIT